MGPFSARKSTVSRAFVLSLLLASMLLHSGCVHRRFTVRTNPPGAVLYVDNQEIGVTPVATSYTYYGTREIRLEKDGFEPVVKLHRFSPPWYQYPGLDFISENLIPWEIRDERELDFEMVPLRIVPPEELRARAEQLRTNAHAGFTTEIVPPQQVSVPSTVVPPATQRVPLWDQYVQPTPAEPSLLPPANPSSGYAPETYPNGTNQLPPGGYELPPLPQ